MALGVTQANASVCSRVYTFADGSILTASQLNTEFNTAINCVNNINESNISPTTSFSPVNINAIIAGDGLGRDGSTGALSVNTDGSTIETSGDALRVKDSGIVTAKIADSNVTTAKIANSNVTTAKIADANVTSAKLESAIVLPVGATLNSKNIVVSNTNSGTGLAIVRGEIDADGTIHNGEGFTVTKSTGDYTIHFTTAFSVSPTVVVTSRNSSFSNMSVVPDPTTTTAEIQVYSGASLVNKPFTFIAIGLK